MNLNLALIGLGGIAETDSVPPTLVISAPSSSNSVNESTITYTITYTGADFVTLANGNITLNTTGGASASVNVTGIGTTTRTITLTNFSGNGTVGISIASGTASDFAGNLAAAAGPSSLITNVDKQLLWDAIAATYMTYGHGAGTTDAQGKFYKETTITTPVINGDEIKGLKAIGTNKPSPANLLFKGNTALTPTNALVWWKDLRLTGLYPMYFDNGNFDKYMEIINGPLNTSYFESDAGSFTAKTRPMHRFIVLRYKPHIADEGVNRFKTVSTANHHVEFIDGYTPDVVLPNGTDLVPYVINIVEIEIDNAGVTRVWINNPDAANNSPTYNTTGIVFSTTEWIWGTSSHALTCDLYADWIREGSLYSTAERADIYAKLQAIWSITAKPFYPFITELYYGDSSTWDGTAKSWRAGRGKTPVFSGGNGVQGTTLYMWYYFQGGDAALFPSADGVLTNHRQVPGALIIGTIASGNSITACDVDGFALIGSAVNFVTSATATADALVTAINAFQTKYFAKRAGTATIQLHPQGLGCNLYSAGVVSITGSGFTPTKINYPRVQDLVRTSFAVNGQIFSGIEGTAAISVMCVAFPFDSIGTPGRPQGGRWILDNIV